ncbi:MAG TPA: hypothetical protein VKP65_17295 [Rhodothermales bacterium]|nr:hypothetical protein [Rhodothermales bacterium]
MLAFEIRDTPPNERAKSTLELYDHFFELENLSDEAAIKLPVALYAALTKLKLKLGPFMQTQIELASKPDNTLDTELHQLQAEATRFLNLARQYLGVDVLSQKSGHMFAKKELEQALETTSLDFIRSVRRYDKKSSANV